MTQSIPRPEHPRPDFEREIWQNLNGKWAFAFDDQDEGRRAGWHREGALKGEITVPFCYQSSLSGIGVDEYHPVLWYARRCSLDKGFAGKRVFLHFGAVDYACTVWVDGEFAFSHQGGYTPFGGDITDLIGNREDFLITLRVEDEFDRTQPRGKQFWGSAPTTGCHYIAVSGIWQTVWLEGRGEASLGYLHITPDIDRKSVSLEFALVGENQGDFTLKARLSFQGTEMGEYVFPVQGDYGKASFSFEEIHSIDEVHYWSPEHPNLFDLEAVLCRDGEETDRVKTYFGMRKVECRDGFVMLNNNTLYQRLILDQGYYPDGLLTAPSDEALKRDILLAKECGFNGARKHQKIEDPRFYYWADKLGYLVWGELPSAYQYRQEEAGNLLRDMGEFVKRDFNHPSIITWVPLNESWGVRNIYVEKQQQAMAAALYYQLKALDPSRPVSTNDGWETVEQSDLYGIHDYTAYGDELSPNYADPALLVGKKASSRMNSALGHPFHPEKPLLITEYGGIAFADGNDGSWGYNEKVQDEGAFLKRYESITTAIQALPYCQGFCYTQLTDVFQETNGLFDMDRQPKVDAGKLREINERRR